MTYVLISLLCLAVILMLAKIVKIRQEIAEIDRKILFSSGKLEGMQETRIAYERINKKSVERAQISIMLELMQEGLLPESKDLHEFVQNKLDSWKEEDESI